MKGQGAASMQTIANKLGSSLGPPHLGVLLQALLAGLPGRTWTGKVSLLYISYIHILASAVNPFIILSLMFGILYKLANFHHCLISESTLYKSSKNTETTIKL